MPRRNQERRHGFVAHFVVSFAVQCFPDTRIPFIVALPGDRDEREPWGPSDFGGALRAAPLGLAYRNAPAGTLEAAVGRALLFSHTHELGLDAALVHAAAVAWLAAAKGAGSGSAAGDAAGPQALLAHLRGVARSADMRFKLELLLQEAAAGGLQLPAASPDWRSMWQTQEWGRTQRLASRLTFHYHATQGTEAVALALAALCANWSRPEQALVTAVHFGGNTGAVACLTGL